MEEATQFGVGIRLEWPRGEPLLLCREGRGWENDSLRSLRCSSGVEKPQGPRIAYFDRSCPLFGGRLQPKIRTKAD